MTYVRNGTVDTNAGDSDTLSVQLAKPGVAAAWWATADLFFTAKLAATDTDEAAVIQKFTGIGITESGAVAAIEFVPFDTVEQEGVTLYCDIRGADPDTGERHTGASWTWKVNKPITKHTDPSITIYTTEPYNTTVRLLTHLMGAEADPTKIGAEYLPNEVVTNRADLDAGGYTTLPDVNEFVFLQTASAPATMELFFLSLPAAVDSRLGQTKTFVSSKPITEIFVDASGLSDPIGTVLTSCLAYEPYVFKYVSTGVWLRLV